MLYHHYGEVWGNRPLPNWCGVGANAARNNISNTWIYIGIGCFLAPLCPIDPWSHGVEKVGEYTVKDSHGLHSLSHCPPNFCSLLPAPMEVSIRLFIINANKALCNGSSNAGDIHFRFIQCVLFVNRLEEMQCLDWGFWVFWLFKSMQHNLQNGTH